MSYQTTIYFLPYANFSGWENYGHLHGYARLCGSQWRFLIISLLALSLIIGHQGWLSGRVTTDDNFTFYKKPALDEAAPLVPEGDFVAEAHAGMYYVSVDPSGKLGWESNQVTYVDTTAHVLEVLTGKASNAYKAFLRKLQISYIIAGEDQLDYELLVEKLFFSFFILKPWC